MATTTGAAGGVVRVMTYDAANADGDAVHDTVTPGFFFARQPAVAVTACGGSRVAVDAASCADALDVSCAYATVPDVAPRKRSA